jgi:type IV secretory pathway TraG/TraD family ATPase VirD4
MSAGARRYDDRHKRSLTLMVLAMIVAAWFFAVHMTYTIPKGQFWFGHYYALLDTLNRVQLWLPPLFAFVFGMAIFIIVVNYTKTGFNGGEFVYRLRGPRMVSPAELKDITKEMGKKQLTFMGMPVPTSKETLHFSVTGSTGSGKTQVIADYMESALKRGDRVICIDPNGGFMANFWKEGDVILNPFDARGKFWGIFNEIKTPYDVEQFAVSLIPKSPSTEGEQWNSMARTIVAETMLKLAKLGRNTTQELVFWLTTANNDDLKTMLAGTAASGMFHGADETLGSVRAVLTRYVTPHKYLSENQREEEVFSIRNWLENGTGNLWVPWREDMLPALKPLISCWVDVICASSLSSDVANAQDIHLVIDEVDSLEKLNYLVLAATKGRKHKLHIFTGIQSYAQLDETNGKNDALTLRNSLRNASCMGIAEGDTYTAEEISKGLGEHEVVRNRISVSAGTMGGRASAGPETVPERMVRPSEIHGLPDLTGYLKFAGDIPFARITMRYKKRPQVTEPIIMIDGDWTNLISHQPRRFGGNFNAVV